MLSGLMDIKKNIIPVIMSGGAGSRLWPLSRKAQPKQFLPLLGPQTMIQETALRVRGDIFTDPIIICATDHMDMVKQQMDDININPLQIITEPIGRNTAPCAVTAAHAALTLGPDNLILLLPADHHIQDEAAFMTAIQDGQMAARQGYLVTFGITPTHAETGYGYIEQGEPIHTSTYKVAAFREKPDAQTAKTYIENGRYSWNAGIFLFDPKVLLSEARQWIPDVTEKSITAYDQGTDSQNGGADNICHLNTEVFSTIDGISIDYAIMEKTTKAAIIAVNMGWNDIGSYAALSDHIHRHGGTPIKGDVIACDTSDSLIDSDGPLICTIGVKNMAIIVRDGIVLVADLDQSQDVKTIIDRLKQNDRTHKL